MAKKSDGKLVAILSYITIVGWLVALILNSSDKTTLGAFHLRQVLLLTLASIVFSFIPILGWILNVGVFILWIIGLVAAIEGQEKEVPLIGHLAQDWFKNLI